MRAFALDVPEAELDDLRRRLGEARWPERETVADWSQGTPLAVLQELCTYWRNGYEWRRCESRLNSLGQFVTTIDGLDVHFLHVRSPHAQAMPLILTHGWPGSVIEFLEVLGPLTDPQDPATPSTSSHRRCRGSGSRPSRARRAGTFRGSRKPGPR